MHDRSKRGRVANALANGFSDSHTDTNSDELTDRVALADRAAVNRTAERAIGHGGVGTRRG